MKLNEIAAHILKEHPELKAEVSEKHLVALIREVFAQMVTQLDQQGEEEKILRIQGFGSFRTRVIEKEKDGQKVSEKRIIFRPAKANPKKSGK